MKDEQNSTLRKIRMQYFNGIIYFIAITAVCISIMRISSAIIDGAIVWSEIIKFNLQALVTCAIIAVPFIILSVLNRFYFGKLVCILDDSGIYHDDRLISWEQIERIDYEIEWRRKYSMQIRFCHATVFTKNETIVINHAPFHLISSTKKLRPDIRASLSKRSVSTLWLFAIALPLISFIMPFIKN